MLTEESQQSAIWVLEEEQNKLEVAGKVGSELL
jgi:hypothetical protein